MGSVSQPGTEPVSPALHGGFLTTGPPGKSRAPKHRKVTRETCVTQGSYKPRLHGRPGLEAALFSLAPATIQQHQFAKGKFLGGEFKQGHGFHTESHLFHDHLDVTKMLTDHQARTPFPRSLPHRDHPQTEKNSCFHFINSKDKKISSYCKT